MRLAWAEAVATYIAAALQHVTNVAGRGIPGNGDNLYTDGEDADLAIDVEGTGGAEDHGEDGEWAVIRFLHDLFDSADDPGDTVSLGDAAILDTLVAARPTTMSAAYRALVAGTSPRERGRIGCVAAEHKMGPVLTRPARNAVLTGTAPTFRWTPNGAPPYLPSDRFRRALLRRGDDEAPACEAADEPSYTPGEGAWRRIRQGAGAAVNVIVRGRQTLDPQTGPYDSCAVRFRTR